MISHFALLSSSRPYPTLWATTKNLKMAELRENSNLYEQLLQSRNNLLYLILKYTIKRVDV